MTYRAYIFHYRCIGEFGEIPVAINDNATSVQSQYFSPIII